MNLSLTSKYYLEYALKMRYARPNVFEEVKLVIKLSRYKIPWLKTM